MMLKDLQEIDGLFFIGDIADVDGSPWVDQETAELCLLEFNKVKKASSIRQAILSLKDGEELKVKYSGKEYKVSAFKSYRDEMSYSVWNGVNGMNVSKVGRTSLSLYTFDMMSQKTTYRMNLLDMEVL